jgi:hypothetical protein
LPAASTRIGNDIPTGALGPSTNAAVLPQAVRAAQPAPRDPCATSKLFGQGAGFCAVN